ncbi:Mpo1-like protein [Colwellia chukchiensis]
MAMTKPYQHFKDFYPFYLSQHQNKTCRRLHFIGSSLIIVMLVYIIINTAWLLLWTLPVIGYGFAWLGHFYFEKNKPATFRYPLYSLLGDWVMFKDILLGKIKL